MRKRIKPIIGCFITICLLVCVMAQLTKLIERKDSRSKYADFFSQAPDFDVLFMGSSHVLNAVFPLELWNQYGIISYNLGGHSNRLPTTYWTLENALDYTHPKVVVIDCFQVGSEWKCSDIFSFVHLSIDAFPLTLTKIRAIWDLLDDPGLERSIENGETRKSNEPRTKIGLLWDYSVYHSRWSDLTKYDFSPSINQEKGAESRIAVKRAEFVKIPSDQKIESGTVGDLYLRRMIEDCQSRGISVLLTYIPFPADEDSQKEANYVYDLADEYGLTYIDFLDTDIVNYQTDIYDKTSHLNSSGARKVTSYLGKVLSEQYGVTNHKDDDLYAFWHKDYDHYRSFKNKSLMKNENLLDYLMLLSGDDIEITMDIRNKDIFKDEWIMQLLANIGIDTDRLSENTDFIIVQNCGKDVTIVDDFRDGNAISSEQAEHIQLVYDEDDRNQENEAGDYKLYVDGQLRIAANTNDHAGLIISLSRDHDLFDTVGFAVSFDPATTTVNVISVERDAYSSTKTG